MGLQEKQQEVSTLHQGFLDSKAAFLFDYTRCTCAEITGLRRKLRPSGARIQVIKNTLARRAVRETHAAGLEEFFSGQTAIILSNNDPVTPAKVLSDFAKTKEQFTVKAAVVDGSVITAKEISALANLPSREVLLGTLLGLLNAPATRLLRTINEPAASLARVLEAWRSKQESAGGGEDKS